MNNKKYTKYNSVEFAFEQKIYFCVSWLFTGISGDITENIFALMEV